MVADGDTRWPSTPRSRVLLVITLLLAQAGLVVGFGTLEPDPSLGRYAEEEHLAADYDTYVGERVSVDGRVVGSDPVTILADHPDGSLRLVIVDVDHAVSEGDSLRIHGVVEPGGTIRAVDSFTVPPAGRTYMFVISFLAGLWVLARVLRDWGYDRVSGGLMPRSGTTVGTGGGEDA